MSRPLAMRPMVCLMGFAGLIPFVTLSLGCWIVHPDWLPTLVAAQLAYGIAILSFLGGIHWGAVLLCSTLPLPRLRIALMWGVTPALIGVVASQMLIGPGFALMIVAFALLFLVDRRLYPWYRIPDWFIALRLKLSCVVVLALTLTVVAVNFRS